uniref:hypothetical protein n=1 Tax=Fusobacterium mortiferum TaxID=850 RepID=UPI003FF0AB2A
MFLLSSVLSIVLLFLLSLLMPVMSFALPIYKIKKMKNFTFREKLIANIIVIILIGLINPWLTPFYLGFFIVIESLYNYFISKGDKVKKFDRIVIISLVTTALMTGLLFLLIYEKNFQISKAESLEVFEMIKNSAVYYIFIYTILSVFAMYISLDIKDYSQWEISFEWLLIYLLGYFAIHLFKIDNFYTNNILGIGECIFIFFGVKTLYSVFSKKIKYKGIANMIAVMLGLLFPFGTFVIGVFGGFKIDKIKINEKK